MQNQDVKKEMETLLAIKKEYYNSRFDNINVLNNEIEKINKNMSLYKNVPIESYNIDNEYKNLQSVYNFNRSKIKELEMSVSFKGKIPKYLLLLLFIPIIIFITIFSLYVYSLACNDPLDLITVVGATLGPSMLLLGGGIAAFVYCIKERKGNWHKYVNKIYKNLVNHNDTNYTFQFGVNRYISTFNVFFSKYKHNIELIENQNYHLEYKKNSSEIVCNLYFNQEVIFKINDAMCDYLNKIIMPKIEEQRNKDKAILSSLVSESDKLKKELAQLKLEKDAIYSYYHDYLSKCSYVRKKYAKFEEKTLQKLYSLYMDGRANDWASLINLYEDLLHKQRLEDIRHMEVEIAHDNQRKLNQYIAAKAQADLNMYGTINNLADAIYDEEKERTKALKDYLNK